VIYSGHDSLIRKTDNPPYYYTPSKRLSFLVYNDLLTKGRIPTMMNKPEGYCSSAIHNIKHLGYEIDNQSFHPEAYTCKPITHEQAARQYLELMKNKHYSKPITDFSVEQIIELFLNRMIEEMELVKNEKRIIFYNKCYNLHKCKKK
jgi:hypothetical protein